MVRELIIENAKIIALFLIVLLSTTVSPFSYASEQVDRVGSFNEAGYIEIEVVKDPNLLDADKEFVYAKSSISDYEGASLDSRDILRNIPSINSKDNKVLGLVMPPFAYFKTAF